MGRGLSLGIVFMVIGLGAGLFAGGYFFYVNYQKIVTTPLSAWEVDHEADCGVVLTGEKSRIPDALEQLYLRRINKLIVSGVFPDTGLNDLFPHRYFYGSLDTDDIILEKRSLTTYGNAVQSLTLVNALNCKDVVLITSRLHMYRAFRTFRSHFPPEIPIYQRSTVGSRFTPHWTRVSLEALKAMFYDMWLY